jgi:hypothetical protein
MAVVRCGQLSLFAALVENRFERDVLVVIVFVIHK